MKLQLASLLATCLLPFGAYASQIVNINALCDSGTSVTLSAGTYQVSVIGTSQGGLYNGWDFATANFNSPAATPAPNDWVDSFDISVNGVTTSYLPSGNPGSDNALDALSLYRSSILFANGSTRASNSPDQVTFTLNSTECVNFTVADYLFVDNWGGTSLSLNKVDPASATPEPSTFGLIGIALAGSIAAFRRKFNS